MAVSDKVKALYVDMYENGREREWRDLCAVDKAENIVRAWRLAGGAPAPRVVEIGCGEGAIAQELSRLSFFSSYDGVDVSPTGIDEATRRGIPNAAFILSAGSRLSFQDKSADLVIMSHVVEHLEHPRELLYEGARIGRKLFVEVPLELNVRAPRDYALDELGHINKFNSTSIRHLLQSCGLKILAQNTSLPNRAIAVFDGTSLRRRIDWRIKRIALSTMPSLARALFVYHEALIAEPPDIRSQ